MGFLRAMSDALGFTAPKAMAFNGSGRAYEAGSFGTREMTDWYPSLTSADDEVIDGREAMVGRARDLYRNHPVIHGAINKIADAVIGTRVLLDAKPMHELLGRDIDWGLDWSLTTEAEFKVWAYAGGHECDIAREASFGQIMRTALTTRLVDGECFVIIRNKLRAGVSRYTTCIELIDTDRITNPSGTPDGHILPNGNTVYGGIEYSRDGEPVAYFVRVKHPAQLNTRGDNYRWERIARFTSTGKPQMVHSFRKHRANQKRGVTALAPVIKRARMGDNYDVAELEAALFDAVNAGFVESPYPTADVAGAMAPSGQSNNAGWSLEKQIKYRTENKVRVEGVRMIHALPGEKFNWKQPARPAGNYPAFKGAVQHDLAAGLGLSYPQLSESWADINFSSARAMMNEKYRSFDSMGEEFCDQVCTPIYLAWLEEAVAINTIKVPGGPSRFYERRNLLGFASWLRPGRGKVDPLKEGQASDLEVHAGRSNNAIECANNGMDLTDVLVGQARERLMREKLGIAQFTPLKIANAEAATESSESDSGTADEADGDQDGIPNEDRQRRRGRQENQDAGA